MTGNTYGAESREELIENHVKQDLERFVFNFDDQRLNIKVESLDSYSFGGGGGPSLGNNYGSGNQFALYQISYEWPLISPLLDVGLGDNDGDYKITARVIVKNEEF